MRLPETLKAAIEAAASHNGRTANDEIIARLMTSQDDRLMAIELELQEIRGMLRKLLDATG